MKALLKKTDHELIHLFQDGDLSALEALGLRHKDKLYTGELAILVDSESASAAEVFPRLMQIEKRAKIYGDQSAGAVMTSNFLQMAK